MKNNFCATLLGILCLCLPLSANAAQKEYLTGKQLENIVRGDNLWCYEFYKNECLWIEDINITKSKITQWYKEWDSGNKIMVKFAPSRLVGNNLCDETPAATSDFSALFYLNDTHHWQAVDKIEHAFDYGAKNTQILLEDYRKHINCYQYIDDGFTDNGYRKLQQVTFIGGDINDVAADRSRIAIIPKLQMYGVKLEARP
ncbi:MAG: hypothetical protein OCD03_08970 [Hyphomicrobiales bacterium]